VARHVVLLRGINLGSRNRVSMPKLRQLLEEVGFDDVQTYVQSGNAVVSSPKKADEVARACKSAIAKELDLDIDVVVRSRAQLAAVVKRNPLGKVATNPKRYQISFLATKPPRGLAAKLEEAAVESERVVVSGREVYAWHPEGVARSKLWALLAGPNLGVVATSRNWTTVAKLLELAEEKS
jgi:uncharacterized protein (DUF1697 family)